MNLDDLNAVQRRAVEHVDGPLLVLAGAGSGKTRVLTYRIAYLIEHVGVDPHRILAVTFTNKAAREMRDRIERLLRPGCAPVWVGTFHSIASRMLRREAEHFGLSSNFVIYDGDDQLALIKRTMKESNVSEKQFAPEAVRSHISGAKDRLIRPAEYAERENNFFERQVARIYAAYQQALFDNNALDFDDLLMHLARGLEDVPSVLERYQEQFRYVLVDEYQDTNHAQYVLVNRLAGRHRNLCVVGDDDQSIYAWRGADIANILDFEKDYPDARVVRLEQNYRSTRVILTAGNEVIKHNRGRKGKQLWTENPSGDPITVMETIDERDEARMVARTIQEDRVRSDRSLRDYAILYRTNAQSRALEDEFRRAAMPYVIVGGVRFFERKEVRDVIAYLKVIVNPRDGVGFRRIVNTPTRGLGSVSVGRLEAFALAEGLTPVEALVRADEAGLSAAAGKSAAALGRFLAELHTQQETLSADGAVKRVIEYTGYLRKLEQEAARSVEAETRAQNVKELVTAIEEFTDRAEAPSTRAFLEEAALVTDVDRWDETTERLTLMTLHNAKGLEFPVVFITGLEDGLFPIARAIDSPTDMEEERRLFYVGITRAQDHLCLSHANLRRRFGDILPGIPSRFLDEVPEEYLKPVSTFRRAGGPEGRPQPGSPVPAPREASSPFGTVRLEEGQRVRHPVWGEGRIVRVNGGGDDMRATIRFSNATKQVMVKYAALKTLP